MKDLNNTMHLLQRTSSKFEQVLNRMQSVQHQNGNIPQFKTQLLLHIASSP